MTEKHQQETKTEQKSAKQSFFENLPLWLEVQPAIRAQLRSPLVNPERVTLTLEAKLSFQPLFASIAELLATRLKAFGQHTIKEAKVELQRICDQLPQNPQLSHKITEDFTCELTSEEQSLATGTIPKELEQLLTESLQIDLGFYIKDRSAGLGSRYFLVAPSSNFNLSCFIQRLGLHIQTKIAAYQSSGQIKQTQSFILKEAEGIFKQAKENHVFADILTEGLGLSLKVHPKKASQPKKANQPVVKPVEEKKPELDLQEMAKNLTLQKTSIQEL